MTDKEHEMENKTDEKILVLLVDDETGFRRTIAKRLGKRQMAVIESPNGKACMEILEKEPVDVVVLDVKMPGMDGIETLKAIKKVYVKKIQVILLTGNAAVSDGIEGIKAGAFDYLTKPVEIDHLVNKIRQAADMLRFETEKQKEQEYRLNLEKKMINTERLASLGTMSTGIAHEINNPLAIINESAGFMKQVVQSPEMAAFPQKQALLTGIEKIEKSIKRARKITLQLLGHVKQQSSQIGECNVKALLFETLSLLQNELDDKNISVQWEMDPEKMTIWSDPYKIRQVCMNLLSNAIHATQENGSITLSGYMIDSDVLLEIRDNGIGIPKENLGKIFDPFFTTKSFDKGTGLGLFVVHKIISALNGEIHVKSEVGKGTCFTIRFPKYTKISDGTDKMERGQIK
ncbi:response regulator [Desulfobacula sp.]|uniref:hybrid sensor histidine kinase/response regulator n=1 Tax=Desulfobacula sp. TaxID=2593537 RepID=UPI0026074DCF|nr:response regulator [Desulfobacula sp.]